MVSELILYFYILPCCKLREKAQLLKQATDMSLAQTTPVTNAIVTGILPIKEQLACVVLPIAQDITTESTLPFPALGLNQVIASTLESDISLPDVGHHWL